LSAPDGISILKWPFAAETCPPVAPTTCLVTGCPLGGAVELQDQTAPTADRETATATARARALRSTGRWMGAFCVMTELRYRHSCAPLNRVDQVRRSTIALSGGAISSHF